MAFVVELLVLEVVHHFCIACTLFPVNICKPLVGHRILELGEDREKFLGHYPATPIALVTVSSPHIQQPRTFRLCASINPGWSIIEQSEVK